MRQVKRLSLLYLCLALAIFLSAVLAWGWLGSPPSTAAQETSATWEVQSNCSEATSNLSRRPYAFDGLAGTCTTPSGADKPALPVSGQGNQIYSYFDVDSSYMLGSTYSFTRLDVEYFDGAYRSQGDTLFYIEYQSSTSVATRSAETVYLNNTQTYVTATFYLTSVNFSNGQQSIADFRLAFLNPATDIPFYIRKVAVTRSSTSPAPSYATASTVSYQAPDTPANRQGLYPVYAGDGHTAANNTYGRSATQASSSNYAYFNVDDTYVYQGGSSYTFASLQVGYYDGGTGRFLVEYDSSSDATGYTSSESAGQVVFLTGSNSWVTATLYLSSIYFGNRQMSGLADFRLNYVPPAGETYRLVFDRVIVTRSATDLTPSFAAAETVSFTSPSSESGLYRVTATGSDGRITTNTDYGRVASQVSSSGYASFKIDDTYLYQGVQGATNYPYAAVEVSYYDKGRGFFLIEYDGAGTDGAYTATSTKERIFLTDSSTWITTTFYLTNTYFGNRQGFSSDLRINYQPDGSSYRLAFDQVSLRRSTANLEANYNAVSAVYFQSPLTQYGVRIRNLGDSQSTLVVITDTQAISRTATQASSSGYARFDVNDSYMYDGNYKYASVEVEYFDQGYGFFYLTYDSSSSLASDNKETQSFDINLQSHNVVYLTNSRTWKTYTFHLSNVRFANRQLLGLADFKLVYNLSGDAPYANQGYTLAFDRVTVTRSNSAPDRTAALVGNYPGFGDPVVVWSRLAQANEEGHGLWQNDSVADGGTTASTQGGQQSRQNSPGGYIYFDVNDNYIKNGNAYNVWVTVEYFDNGTNSFNLEYDSTSGTTKATDSVTRTGTNAWKRYTFNLTDAYFGNRQNGDSDFRITAPAKDLYVKRVYVQRAPGSLVRPRLSSLGAASSFTTSDRVVVAHYFPVFDYYYPSLWEISTITPTATLQNGYPVGHSWRSVETLKQDLEDMKAAKVDVASIWYQGGTGGAAFGGVQAVKNLVTAAQQITNSPKLALFLDPVNIYHEEVLKEEKALQDLTTSQGKGILYRMVESFYSLVPSNLRATINGRPLLVIYSPGGAVGSYNASTIQYIAERFENSFGVQPYIVVDILWDADGSKGINVDQFFAWSAALYPSGYTSFWTSTASVGPGFKEARNPTPGQAPRERSREDGAFYSRSWAPVIARGPQIAFIETWNYWVEGSGIADSIQYGRQFITATAQLAQSYKSTTYKTAATASVILGATNTNSGLYQDELSTAATTAVTIGGQTGRKAARDNMFFSVHDSFIYKAYFPLDITVEYYDGDSASGGTDWFAIQYDSTGGAFYPPSITEENSVDILKKGNSKTWKTKTFRFTNTYFGNRQDNRNDFVLKSPGGLVVRQVTVTRPAILDLPNKIYIPLATKSASGW